jgi:hypothetical protein
MTGLDEGKNERRLESWKEIAGFFNRDEKTVRRWEKDLGLPVHRLPGVSKGRVYAFAQELSEWSAKPRTLRAEGASESDPELVVSPVAVIAPPEIFAARAPRPSFRIGALSISLRQLSLSSDWQDSRSGSTAGDFHSHL